MDWFKFYGKDWLTDIKIMQLGVEDRLCFITLLCLASNSENPGVIKNCKEEAIIKLTHLDYDPYNDDNPASRAKGFLQRLSDNEMITFVTDGNVTVINFEKRQSKALSGYERIKRYRENQKEQIKPKQKEKKNDNEMITNDNANDNARKEKKREDKKRINTSTAVAVTEQKFEVDKSTEEYLNSLPDIGYVMELFRRAFGTCPKPVKNDTGKDLNALVAGRLVKKFTREGLRGMLELIFRCQKVDKYCKICTNPLDFEKNYIWYQTYLEQKKKGISGGILK